MQQEKVCKYVYDKIISSRPATNHKKDVWSNKLGTEVFEEEWSTLFFYKESNNLFSFMVFSVYDSA